jgi:hypothetical protein
MLHEDIRRKTPVHVNSEMTGSRANVLVTHFARSALPATDPGIHGDLGTGFCIGIRSRAFDRTGNFVAERERQRAPGADVEFLVATQRKVTILHVQVGMADATSLDPHQDLGALRLRDVNGGFAQGRAVSHQ